MTDNSKNREAEEVSETGRHRNWCFTLNNYTDDEVTQLKESMETSRYIYLCWGYETCPTTGTPHLQGYVECKEGRTFRALLKDPGFNRARFFARAARSNKVKAVTYCAKDYGKPIYTKHITELCEKDKSIDFLTLDTEDELLKWMRTPIGLKEWRQMFLADAYQQLFYEGGDWNHGLRPGTRNDINVIKELVKKGANFDEIAEASNNLQTLKFGQTLLSYRAPKRDWKTDIFWISGPSGVGKTQLAFELAKQHGGDLWIAKRNLDWFDGYQGQEIVIIDEFRGSQCSYEWMLRLTDGYPMSVAVKGGFTDWTPRIIIITSISLPEDAFNTTDQEDPDCVQILRRITNRIHLTKPRAPIEPKVLPEKAKLISDFFDSLIEEGFGVTKPAKPLPDDRFPQITSVNRK